MEVLPVAVEQEVQVLSSSDIPIHSDTASHFLQDPLE